MNNEYQFVKHLHFYFEKKTIGNKEKTLKRYKRFRAHVNNYVVHLITQDNRMPT